MYVKVTNGTPTPYTIGQLRRDNPRTSFPKAISDSTLAEYNVYRVQMTAAPEVDSKTHRLVDSIENVDGAWTAVWSTQQLPEDQASNNVRAYRNRLLEDTDFYALTDVTMTQAMATYRQALRDVPAQAGFPHSVTWPTQPE